MSDARPFCLLLLGITGDLASGKILPALYHLEQTGRLPAGSRIIGTSRKMIAASDIIDKLSKTLQDDGIDIDQGALDAVRQKLSMVQLDPSDSADYPNLTKVIDTGDSGVRRLTYLSLPPQVYGEVVAQLARHDILTGPLLIEKPFGSDLESAEQLITDMSAHIPESQVFRIDHYLAKDRVADFLRGRSDDPQLAGRWTGSHIAQLTLTAAESIGIAGRAGFYDNIGAMRDLIQSHLLQVLATLLVDADTPETAFTERLESLVQLIPADPSDSHRAQYDGYSSEIDKPDSDTETYAAVTLRSRDPAWEQTTFRLITGKALSKKYTGITAHFDDGPDYNYDLSPQDGQRDDSYEQVLLAALDNDHSRFVSDEQVLAAWRLVQPLLDAWQSNTDDLGRYEQGSNWPL